MECYSVGPIDHTLSTNAVLFYMFHTLSTNAVLFNIFQRLSANKVLFYIFQTLSTNGVLFYIFQTLSTNGVLFYSGGTSAEHSHVAISLVRGNLNVFIQYGTHSRPFNATMGTQLNNNRFDVFMFKLSDWLSDFFGFHMYMYLTTPCY